MRRLKFGSGEALKKIVGDAMLDEALDDIGFSEISSLFRIEVNQGGEKLGFSGWVSVL
jgi:hypothetical protein